jgi:ABC-type transport system involved in cytochrome bd biosynthesis fused ATPase/permease subunit
MVCLSTRFDLLFVLLIYLIKFYFNLKTRVFVTNSLNYLPSVDKILMIENGNIVEMGTYEQLKSYDGAFSRFIKIYLETHESNKENFSN